MSRNRRLRDTIIDSTRSYDDYGSYDRVKPRIEVFMVDEDNDIAVRVKNKHKKRSKQFSDRLKPLFRWLRSQHGKPWNEVYSMLCRNNDRRNIRAYHLIDHVVRYVEKPNEPYRLKYGRITGIRHGFLYPYIDDDGILISNYK